jgi:hypothetical protein
MQELHAGEWIDRCSKRLQEHWRNVEPAQLDDLAIELWSKPEWRALPPEQAALGWLKQGVLANA